MPLIRNLHNAVPFFQFASNPIQQQTEKCVGAKPEWYENKFGLKGHTRYPVTPTSALPQIFLHMDADMWSQKFRPAPSAPAPITLRIYKCKDDMVLDYCTDSHATGTSHDSYFTYVWRADVNNKVYNCELTPSHAKRLPVGAYYYVVSFGPIYLYSQAFVVYDAKANLCDIAYINTINVDAGSAGVQPMNIASTNITRHIYLIPDCVNITHDWKYQEEMTDMDGFERVEKRVSYMEHKLVFISTEYLIEAMRLAWQCDNVTISYDGQTYNVDYMAQPEANTTDVQALREVTLTFKTDTIMQTNGGAENA